MSHRRPLPAKARFPKDLSVISDRQYGERVGVFRILDLFSREGITTTFFINGITAELHPETIREIKERGHEVATESYIHDYNFMKAPEEESAELARTVEAVKKTIGEPPLGFLSMGVQPTEHTPVACVEQGYVYWADLQHEDLPYTLKVNGQDLVVLDYIFALNDYNSNSEMSRTPRDLLQLWKDCFDCLYREGTTSPKMMMWGLHPFLSGRPYRAIVLEEFISYAKRHEKVWFPRCIDVARYWLGHYREAHVEPWPNALRMVDPPYISRYSVQS
jgi:peptidoglycan/xylan/chitin deacetylase (PgdA/CDA1 family)